MLNLSVNFSSVLDSLAGDVSKAVALCKNAAMNAYVAATAGNRAAVGGNVWSVSLEGGQSGNNIRSMSVGLIDAADIGSLTGTGDFVNVQADGTLARAASISADTIGYYLNGDVFVFPPASKAGANAVQIQGVPVTSAVTTKSWIFAGDGSSVRMRKDIPCTRDYGMAADGVTSDRAKLVQFFADVGTYGAGKIHQPASGGMLIDGFPIEIHDDTASGRLVGLWLVGELADPFNPSGHPTFVNNVACPNGSAASITTYGNGGSGQTMQTLTGLTGVLAADADHYVGRPIRLRGCDTKAHNGEFFITSVPSDGTVTIYQPNVGAGAVDANSGAIRWKIYMPMLDVRCREFRLEGIYAAPKTGVGKLGPLLEIGQPYRSGGSSVINWAVHRCAFASASSTALSRYGVQIAKQIVPRVGHSQYATNGAGVPQVVSTSQVDTGDFYRCAFTGMDELGVCHSSPSAQSKEITFRKCQFGPSSRNVAGYGGIGYGVPRNTFGAGGVYAAEGSPGANFYDCSFGALDVGVQLGSGSSMPVDFHSCYWESTQRPFRSYSAPTTRPINFFGCGIAPTGTAIHPSREWCEILSDGPLNFFGTNIQVADNSKYHAVFASNSGKENKVGLFGAWLKGTTTWTGHRARVTARLCGPYCFTSGDTMTFNVDGGANQVLTLTVANFTTAGVANVNLDEVESWQLGKFIDYWLTGCEAWGEFDNGPVVVESATEGGTSRIEYVSATGKAAYLDFPTGAQAGTAQSTLCSDTSGWFDYARTAGTVPLQLTSHGVLAASGSGTQFAWPEGVKRYGTTYVNDLIGPNKGTFTAVTGGIVTVAGAVVTIADTRVTVNSVVSLIPTNAAAVTLGQGYLSARTADTSFAFTFAGAPAGTETFIYTIQEAA